MNLELFTKSFELMVVGMGMTFSFLIILVFILNVLRWGVNLLNKICPEKLPEPAKAATPVHDDTKLKIAIAIAAIKAAK